MKHTEIAYLAGIIDGEGSVSLTKRNGKYRCPHLVIPNTDLGLLEWIKDNFGGHISSKKKTKKHHTQSYVWAISYDKALNILEMVLPYLRTKKKIHRATLLVNEYKNHTSRNGRYTDEQLANKREFENRFFEGAR